MDTVECKLHMAECKLRMAEHCFDSRKLVCWYNGEEKEPQGTAVMHSMMEFKQLRTSSLRLCLSIAQNLCMMYVVTV